jgi:AcrR family transcriptional regulator
MSPRAGVDPATVVAAAAGLADADGLGSLTLAKIAAELGVRSPSLYAHVDGIADVLRKLGAKGAGELAAAIGHAVEGRSGSDALRALCRAYRDYARRHPGSYAAAQRSHELQKDPDAAAAAESATRVAMAVLRGYGLEGDEAIHAARLIRVTLHGFVALEAEEGFAIAVSLEDTFDRVVASLDLVLRSSDGKIGNDA